MKLDLIEIASNSENKSEFQMGFERKTLHDLERHDALTTQLQELCGEQR